MSIYENPVVNTAIGFTPVLGDIQSGAEAIRSAMKGNYGEAALNAVGLLPFVPSLGGMARAADTPITQAMRQPDMATTPVSQAMRQADLPNNPNFTNWFGGSKMTNADGTPMVLYHGSPYDIGEHTVGKKAEFHRGRRGAIFFSPDPAFASTFAGGEMAAKYGKKPNVMPVFIKAENPFDFENPEHVNRIMGMVKGYDDFDRKRIASGLYEAIEDRDVQKALKQAGFDSFFVKEKGVKNIGVFEPTQIKSATGNKGTYDPKNPDIISAINQLQQVA
jgi:hypothetical protein